MQFGSMWNIFNDNHKQQAIEAFDSWRQETKSEYTEHGIYNSNKAFVRFITAHLINFDVDFEHLEQINALAELLKKQGNIDSPELIPLYTEESFNSVAQEVINLDKVMEMLTFFEQYMAKNKDRITHANEAFIVFLIDKRVRASIPTLAEINWLAVLVNQKKTVDASDRLNCPFSYGSIQMMLGKIIAEPDKLQTSIDEFNAWQSSWSFDRSKYFKSGWLSPQALLLGFLKEAAKLKGDRLQTYGQFCVFATMLKEQGKIINPHLLTDPPCSYNEFDKAYRSMYVRELQISPILINFQKLCLVASFLLLIMMADKNFNKSKPLLRINDITTDKTPEGKIELFAQNQYVDTIEQLSRCIIAEGCPKSDWKKTVTYTNSWDLWSDKLFGTNRANMTFERSPSSKCSISNFFICADKIFDGSGPEGFERLKPLLLTNNTETCLQEEENNELSF